VPDNELLNAYVAGVEGDVVHVLAGGVRVDARGASLRFADDVIPTRIEHAVRVSRGWVFVTWRDEVYASDTFTGRLRALRTFACPASDLRTPVDVSVSEGRVTLTVGGAHPHWTDGVTVEPLRAGTLTAAWAGDAEGMALMEDATLWRTRDGGGSWHQVARGDRAVAVGVAGVGGALYALTSEGWRILREGDIESIAAPPLPSPVRVAPPPEVRAAMERALGRRFDRAPAAPATCLAMPPPVEPFARPPGAPFAAEVPTRRSPDGALAWSIPPGVATRLGTVGQRAGVEGDGIPALATLTRWTSSQRGLLASWRGEDDRGGFTRVADAVLPEGMDDTYLWRAVVATRAGLVLQGRMPAPGSAANDDRAPQIDALFWIGGARVWIRGGRVRATNVSITGCDLEGASGVALDDGGALVLVRSRCEWVTDPAGSGGASTDGRRLATAVLLGPDGVEREHRSVALTRGSLLTGLGEQGGCVGVAVSAGADPATVSLRCIDGRDVDLGRWQWTSPPPLCGARAATTARLHLTPEMRIGPSIDGVDFAELRLATFERATGAPPCVRRLWGVHRDEVPDPGGDEGDDYGESWAAYRATARDGRLVGTYDDGWRIATLPLTLRAAP
jgi:hypothetical protein